MAIGSITRRWVINSLGIIFIILVAVEMAAIFAIKGFYYSTAEQFISSRLSIVSELIVEYSEDSSKNLSLEIRNIIENFNEKDKIELMGINHQGEVIVSSSGFYYLNDIPLNDYTNALESETGRYTDTYTLKNNEKLMSICMIVPVINNEFTAVRFLTSLSKIDKQIASDIISITLLFVVIFIFVLISGFYFIKSIVIPVRQVGVVARKIASGDFEARIEKHSNDELGELCDIINYMAGEISNSDKMKNDFISSVSHELRTPLTAIKGWGETIMTTKINDIETIRKGMRVIISESERLSSMVEELLDFSIIQSGRFKLIKTKIDILAELEEALIMYVERGKRDNIDIQYHAPDMLPFIFGDKNRLRQVFLNIIDNAIKYSESGGIITINACEQEKFIIVKVKDNGCGINESNLPFVKRKFYKANISRRGSGIGLAIATEIVDLHDGELEIYSQENIGTEVTIRLPINLKKGEERATEITDTAEIGDITNISNISDTTEEINER